LHVVDVPLHPVLVPADDSYLGYRRVDIEPESTRESGSGPIGVRGLAAADARMPPRSRGSGAWPAGARGKASAALGRRPAVAACGHRP
jgi:hypothetical protein